MVQSLPAHGWGLTDIAYDLTGPTRLWVDHADVGFLVWTRYEDTVVMSAELELAAWTATGEKLWTTWLEPRWHYALDGDSVLLDVMGKTSTFPLHRGPVRDG